MSGCVGRILTGYVEFIFVGKIENVGINLGIGVLQLRVNDHTFDAINGDRLQHGRVLDTHITAEAGERAAHSLGPVTGAEFTALAGYSLNDDFGAVGGHGLFSISL